MRIDLHAHSRVSDGTESPAEVMAAAEAAGLDVVALTDHDTTGGWAEAAAARPPGLVLVPGAEISCKVPVGGWRVSVHLLAYLFDPAEPLFAAERMRLRDSRVGRARRMVEMLVADGHPVSWEEVAADAGTTIGRPHVARALVRAGLVDSVDEAFGPDWLGSRGRYFVGKYELDAFEALRLIVGAGGVAVFAHPRATRRGPTVPDETIVELARAGLAGLEVDHPDHDRSERRQLRGLARELGLLVTGASDYHGDNKRQSLGAETTAPEVYEALVAGAVAAPVGAAR